MCGMSCGQLTVDFAVNCPQSIRMDYRSQLLVLGRAYAEATGRSLPRVATQVRNDGKFFKRLEDGGGCTMDTYGRCIQWFADNWPTSADWPDGVGRPTEQPTRSGPEAA